MPKGHTDEKEYDELYERIESKVDLKGNENFDKFTQKVLIEFFPNSPSTFPWDEMWIRFEESKIREKYLEAKAESEQLPTEFQEIFEKNVEDGMDPRDALYDAKEKYNDYLKSLRKLTYEKPTKEEAYRERIITIAEREIAVPEREKYERWEHYAYRQAIE